MNSVSPALIARRALALVAFALVTLLCAAYAIAMPAQAYAADADGNVGRTRFVEGETGTYWKSWSDLFQNIKDTGKQTDSDTVIFDIYGDFDTSSLGMIEVPAGKTFTFNLHGHMINRGLTNASSVNSGKGNGEVFCVKGKLIVNGGDTSDGGSIAHNGNLSENGRFWKYDGSGTAPINGGLITGGACDDADSAGGIYVANGGASVELNDVTVAGNVGASYSLAYGATTRAGGISLYKSSCSLKMSNSKVLYNYSASNGGGINVSGSGCTVEITSGSQVSSNTTGDSQYAWGGGGIYFNGSGSSLVISGGSKVDNNYTPNNGGGIYHNFSNGTIDIKGSSEVCDNVAGGNGGGIYDCYDGTTINISGSKVDGNSAVNGGGIFLEDAATLNITNEGSVSGNKAAGGAGIYINDEGTSVYVKNNSTVSNNEATGNGGGIYHNDKTGVVSFDSSTLSGNKAGGNGGGVYNGYGEGNSYSFANGSSVSGNEANNGGGLFSIKEVYVYVKINSSICNNIAKNDGGGIYCTSEPLNLTFTDNGSMHGNTAGADGGAICSVTSLYVMGPDYSTRVWYNDYKTIYGNKASKGAGIWFAGDARLGDVVITDNLASSIGGGVYCDNDTDEAFCFNNTVVVKDNKMGADTTSLQSNVVIKGTQLLHGYDKLDTDAYPSASTCVYVTVEDYVNGSRILCDERFTKNFDKESSSCTNVVADDTSCCKIVFNEDGTLSNELADGEVTSLDVTLTINFGNSQSVTIKTYKYAFLKIRLADYAKNGYAPDYFTTSWNGSKLEPWKSDSNYTGVQMPTKADSYAITAHYPHYKVNVSDFSTINDFEAGSTVELKSSEYKKDGLEPTYWTIEDAAGNMQILWPKDGVASFAMLGSDVNATPHYPVTLSGVDVTLSESSTWDGLVPSSDSNVNGASINSVAIATDSASYVLTADELKDATIVSRVVQTQDSDYARSAQYTVQIPSSVFAAYNITLPAADVSLVASGAVYAQNVDKYTYEGKTNSSYGAAVATDGEVSYVKFTATEYYTQPVAEAVCVTTNCVNANDASTTLSASSDYCTKDQSVSVTPPTKAGWKFAGWVGDKPAGATEDATTHALTFTPSSAITLTASYIPLVSAVDISVDALVADGSFPAQAKAANARDNAGTKFAAGTSSIVWTRTDGSALDAKPAKDASYNATLALGLSAGSDQDATAYQWAFADTVSVTLNGTPVVADKVKVSGSQQLEVSYTETPVTGTDDRIFTVSFDAGDIAEAPAT